MRLFFSLLSFFFITIAVGAESFEYEEGTHYVELEVPIEMRDSNIVNVTEYFSYGCPHCYRFEPLVSQWKEKLPDDVQFDRSPAVWKVNGYELYARTYYTAKALGIVDKVHLPLFNAIHVERRQLRDLNSMAVFLGEHGVDSKTFVKTFNDSLRVTGMYQRAIGRQQAYRSGGVPAIIVNGKYRIEAGMVDNSNANMLRVADYLIKIERRLIASGKVIEE